MTDPQQFVLDTSALIQHPEILARTGRRKLVIPEAVLDELSGRGRQESRAEFASIIQQAIARGAHIAPNAGRADTRWIAATPIAKRLTGADIDVANIAIEYAERLGSSAVVVVTLDRALQPFLAAKGIKSVTGTEFLSNVSGESPDEDLQRSAQSFATRQWKFAARSVALGLAFSVLGNLAFLKFSVVFKSWFAAWTTSANKLFNSRERFALLAVRD